MKIELHIERLVLEGLSLGPGDAARVQAAVEAALTGWLAGLGPDALRGGALDRLDAPGIALTAGARPEEIGGGVGRAVGEAIAPGSGATMPPQGRAR
jgi:hypothetical protein